MAERRMFSKSVVESDNFLDMPAEAQALYFHLNMAADDYGFCDNPRSIMRACSASNDTMKLLIAKKFVISFEKKDGFIVVVKHWRINNYIREDRKHETKYKELMRELYYDENNSYSTNPDGGHIPCVANQLSTNCQPTDCQPADTRQASDIPRLGKDSIDKVSVEKDRIEKGGIRGEPNQPEIPAAQQEILPELDNKRERIIFWKNRINFMISQNFDAGCMYDLAKREGITKADIDNFKEDEP